MRLGIGITGATGAVYAVRLLEVLRRLDVETHLVISRWAEATIRDETDRTPDEVRALATHHYSPHDQAARISSGSFRLDGAIIIPCSMKTLAAIAHGYGDNLITRLADVSIKEGRRLVVVPRETPFSAIHLENMLKLARLGVVVFPPLPAWYLHPRSLDDLVDQTVGRILDKFDLNHGLFRPYRDLP